MLLKTVGRLLLTASAPESGSPAGLREEAGRVNCPGETHRVMNAGLPWSVNPSTTGDTVARQDARTSPGNDHGHARLHQDRPGSKLSSLGNTAGAVASCQLPEAVNGMRCASRL